MAHDPDEPKPATPGPALRVVGDYDPVAHGWKEPYHLLQTEHNEIHWLVDRLLAPGTLNILSGNSKSFKTWLLHSICIACATGGKLFGQFPCRKCRVMFVQAEEFDRQHELKYRWTCAGAHLSVQEMLGMHVLSWCGRMKMQEAEGRDNFRKAFTEWLPNLVIVDSLRRTQEGDERDIQTAQHMKDEVDTYLREYSDSAWLINHHHRKVSGDSARDEPGEMLAGHGDLRAVVDGHLSVKRDKKTNTVTFIQDACRDGAEMNPFVLRFRTHEGRAWFEWLGYADAERHTDPTCAVVRRELASIGDWVRTPDLTRHMELVGMTVPVRKVRTALERLFEERSIYRRDSGDTLGTYEWKAKETEAEVADGQGP